jgi:hypothetical protein
MGMQSYLSKAVCLIIASNGDMGWHFDRKVFVADAVA